MTKPITMTSEHIGFLHELGLSHDAIALYGLLLTHGSLSAQAAALYQRRLTSAQYRLFYKLEAFGLVQRTQGRPITFAAISPKNGFAIAQTTKETLLKQALARAVGGEAAIQAAVLVGRQALYSKYIEHAEATVKSIDVFAIGIAYSDELVAVQRRARSRGVRVRHVVQEYKPANFHVLHNWNRIGVKVRLARAERGFHVMLFDSKYVLVSFSNATNTDDRLSIGTDNSTAVQLFGNYFEDLWLGSQEIEV